MESRALIVPYIKAQGQSLLIRSALKMILNYLRDYDPVRYITELQALMRDNSILFHLKHLVISMLAARETPSDQEVAVFQKLIAPVHARKVVFFEHVYGIGWNPYIFGSGLLDEVIDPKTDFAPSRWERVRMRLRGTTLADLRNKAKYLDHVLSQFLRKQMQLGTEAAFDLALRSKDQVLTRWLVHTLVRWDNPKAYQLLAMAPEINEKQDREYFHIMENILEYNPTFVLEQVREVVLVDKYFDGAKRNDLYDEKKFLAALSEKLPKELTEPLLKNLQDVIDDPRYAEMGLTGILSSGTFH